MKVSFTSSSIIFANKSQDNISCFNRIDLLPSNLEYESDLNWINFHFTLGIYSYQNADFLILVDKWAKVNSLIDIYEIKSVKILQITPGDEYKSIIQMLYDSFLFNKCYFCLSHPLHLTFSSGNIYEDQSRNIFMWNFNQFYKMQKLIKNISDQVLIPIINGSVSSFENFVLISRRSNTMCGARFWLRGSDDEGNSANFIETESILFDMNDTTSHFKTFVQIRGSLPLHWTEYPNLTFLPEIKVDESEESTKRFQKHIQKISLIYPKQNIFIINLTSKKGREKKLTFLYEKLCLEDKSLIYHHIDTEQTCGVLHWDRLTNELGKIDYNDISFNEVISGNLLKKQTGIIRTNCADSIDRTNIIQCEINIKVFKEFLLDKSFELKIRECWVDNGNKLAKQIVGSNALKNEITLYQHRTLFGLLKDAFESLVRFHYDNFVDGYRQDCLDCCTLSIKCIPNVIAKRNLLDDLWTIFTTFILMILFLVSFQFHKFENIKKKLKEKLIDKPHFRKVEFIE